MECEELMQSGRDADEFDDDFEGESDDDEEDDAEDFKSIRP